MTSFHDTPPILIDKSDRNCTRLWLLWQIKDSAPVLICRLGDLAAAHHQGQQQRQQARSKQKPLDVS
jgi:hypothetical protein